MTQTNEGPGPLPGEPGPTQSVNSAPQDSAAGPRFHPSDVVLAAALQYALRGWRVLPVYGVLNNGMCQCLGANCAGPGKHPLVTHGVSDATPDLEVITRWWSRPTTANVGIGTGAGSGLVVIDIDPRHGGDETLERLLEEHGRLPDTPEVLTGGGGRNLYFAHPGGRVLSKTIAPGVDVKGDGGYVVAPPGRAFLTSTRNQTSISEKPLGHAPGDHAHARPSFNGLVSRSRSRWN